MLRKIILFITLVSIGPSCFSQSTYWQQEVAYTMEIDLNVETNRFTGLQTLVYMNNSPDTLYQVFYHLYFNAFQTKSMMDVRSRSLEDPDPRVVDRILNLKEDEQGYQKIRSLKQDGKPVKHHLEETVLEVDLADPILPGKSSTFSMDFEAQVPLQIRRSGRDNKEGIRYSMTQWYPKLAEYDYQGWHADPYIAREFHGVWGSFDVKISIDKSYVLGATGYLENNNEIGMGYEDSEVPTLATEQTKNTWHFVAPMVHDFAWVADPDFTHKKAQLKNGTTLHFLYQADSTTMYWDSLPKYAVAVFENMNSTFGKYPYKQYTIAQGGDGGMEYPMMTLITGKRSKGSLIGVTSHEAIHSWYQHLLATNESQYPWMDEGFTSYAEDVVLMKVLKNHVPFVNSYKSYFRLIESGKMEPLVTHADHYKTNRAYGTASYSMGLIFLNQLGYVIGEETMMRGMKRYFNEWKFKHPNPNDLIRIMEKESRIELDWYLEQWIETSNTIDYGIHWMDEIDGKTVLTIERIGEMPMPLDVLIKTKDGKEHWVNIPLRIMRGEKSKEKGMGDYTLAEDWPWTHPYYDLKLPMKKSNIVSIEIDPSQRMADVDRSNNTFPFDKTKTQSSN